MSQDYKKLLEFSGARVNLALHEYCLKLSQLPEVDKTEFKNAANFLADKHTITHDIIEALKSIFTDHKDACGEKYNNLDNLVFVSEKFYDEQSARIYDPNLHSDWESSLDPGNIIVLGPYYICNVDRKEYIGDIGIEPNFEHQ